MLIGNFNEGGLPQDELTYAAFRLAAIDTLMQIEMAQHSPDGADPIGFLDAVPVLAEVAPVVQVDLLADAWHRHRSAESHKASLLDAAVVYAVCETAARLVQEIPELVGSHLASGPTPCHLTIDQALPERFQSLFESFWGDIDFMTLEYFGDIAPDKARRIKKVMGISNSQVKKLESALARAHASPEILTRLQGLLTEEELKAWSRWLVPPVIVSLRDVVGEMDILSDTFQAYINRKTGELFTATDSELLSIDDEIDEDAQDWQIESIKKLREIRDSDDWLELPSKHGFHEWEVMADFCQSIENELLREDFLDAIRGGGAFGRFKNMAARHGLVDDWHRFRDNALSEFVASWLRANGIAYRK